MVSSISGNMVLKASTLYIRKSSEYTQTEYNELCLPETLLDTAQWSSECHVEETDMELEEYERHKTMNKDYIVPICGILRQTQSLNVYDRCCRYCIGLILTSHSTRNKIGFLPKDSMTSSISITRSNLRISQLTRDSGNIRGFCVSCRLHIKRNKISDIKNLKHTPQVVSETSERGTQTKRNRLPSNVQSVLVLPPCWYEILPPYCYELRS